jgi:hypothetical protein
MRTNTQLSSGPHYNVTLIAAGVIPMQSEWEHWASGGGLN